MNRILIFLLGAAVMSQAQTATPSDLAELTKRADIICTGIPVKVEVIEVRDPGELLNFNVPPPKHVTVATIKVVSRAKGAVPDKIEMRYPVYTPARFSFEGEDNHNHIKLEPGKRYRFFLKQVEGELWYAGALEGEADDGAAVQPEGAVEWPAALLSKKEVMEKLDRTFAGERAELTVSGGKSKGSRIVRGLIENVKAATVTVLVDGTGNTSAKPETFSKTDILKVLLLPDPHLAQ